MNHLSLGVIAFSIVSGQLAFAANPIEVGRAQWGRDLEAGQKVSRETGRPVFLLFQEIPGCDGCQKFGSSVLSHPLIVEAIEDEFIPVLIHNNKAGYDKKILDRFKEPAWNYQVVRFLDADGRDLIPRKDRVWTIGELAERMVEALSAAKRPVPKYLEVVAAEYGERNHATSAFAMHCYWTGEMELGAIDGVITTEAGWLEGREVTRVVYDKTQLSLNALAAKARRAQCAQKVYAAPDDLKAIDDLPTGPLDDGYRIAKPSDQKKQISTWRALLELPGITEMQKTKINALAPSNRSAALEWLSPRQRRALADAGHVVNRERASSDSTE